MATYITLAITCILMMIFQLTHNSPINNLITSEVNVMAFGAVGDGIKDDSLAINQAWDVACNSTGQLTLPNGNFLVGPMTFSGPCKAKTVVIKVIGTVKAQPKNIGWPAKPDTWLNFQHIDNLIVTGTGTFDGQGVTGWWDCKVTHTSCENNPTALGFHSCNGLKLVGVTSVNSPRNHISIDACNGAVISNVNIHAPEESPNTDGIDISATNGVTISGGIIATGDDCIAINGGSFNINVTGLTCGPGHGISIGSLGRLGAKDVVGNIMVVGTTFNGTQNGARIKTVPGGSGSATQITFRNIIMTNVQHPIILTQFYCPHVDPSQCHDILPFVGINGVSFVGINGSCSGHVAIEINCSAHNGSCENIILQDINLIPANSSLKVESTCKNAKPIVKGVLPQVNCTSKSLIEMPMESDQEEKAEL